MGTPGVRRRAPGVPADVAARRAAGRSCLPWCRPSAAAAAPAPRAHARADAPSVRAPFRVQGQPRAGPAARRWARHRTGPAPGPQPRPWTGRGQLTPAICSAPKAPALVPGPREGLLIASSRVLAGPRHPAGARRAAGPRRRPRRPGRLGAPGRHKCGCSMPHAPAQPAWPCTRPPHDLLPSFSAVSAPAGLLDVRTVLTSSGTTKTGLCAVIGRPRHRQRVGALARVPCRRQPAASHICDPCLRGSPECHDFPAPPKRPRRPADRHSSGALPPLVRTAAARPTPRQLWQTAGAHGAARAACLGAGACVKGRAN